MTEQQGGRVFFSGADRSIAEEDEVTLVSVGVDIGSSTSHLAFSRLVLEKRNNRFVVIKREIIHQSAIMFTPYEADWRIDTQALDRFIRAEYANASLDPEDIDTGALILTGVAMRRSNARAIGELFSAQAGKFVALSAGDALETILSAHGSGAVASSAALSEPVMNVDIGGGTSKISLCVDGRVTAITAIDIGARLVCVDQSGRIVRLEEAGERLARELGIDAMLGAPFGAAEMDRIAALMAERLMQAMGAAPMSPQAMALLRLEPLPASVTPAVLSFSGGVSEYIFGTPPTFDDLGAALARAVVSRAAVWGLRIQEPTQRIRATVIGASQYTVQVSGSTIYISGIGILPLRNMAVVAPLLPLEQDEFAQEAISDAIEEKLVRLGGEDEELRPVALFYNWHGSAIYQRLDQFTRGVLRGLARCIAQGQPLVLVGDSDVGGLIGIHLHEELQFHGPIVSIDGVTMNDFDFVDIGDILPTSGAVPVIIKSLVFPSP